jgi:hypothetical protein
MEIGFMNRMKGLNLRRGQSRARKQPGGLANSQPVDSPTLLRLRPWRVSDSSIDGLCAVRRKDRGR